MADSNKKPVHTPTIKNPFVFAGVSVLVIILGWFFVVDPLFDQRDRQRFEEAEAFLLETYEEKIRPIAEADEITTDNNCRYSSAKLEEGELTCSVRLKLSYAEEKGLVFSDIQEISSRVDGSSSIAEINEDDYYSQEIENSIGDDFFCFISYRVNESNSIHLNCSSAARTEHFPVEQ